MTQTSDLRRTPLHALHQALGAKTAPFAGYEMPIQYPEGVMQEHLHTRAVAGLFDVSHMGQVRLRPRSGVLADAAEALERLVPADVMGLKPGRQRYGLFTNASGGILDDLMIANLGDHLHVVVNAACKAADLAHMQDHLADACEIELVEDRALIALQGPAAEAALSALAPDCAAMRFMDAKAMTVDGSEWIVTRSGYSGEDGFEVSIPADQAEAVAKALLDQPGVKPIGLGARDSLRLEAGLCLYGNDIDPTTTPVEAGLEWAIQKVRRVGGQRAGGFPGAETILAQFQTGASRRRVGLKPEGRAPMRAGTMLFAESEGGDPIGAITSGGFGPSVGGPVSMGYVPIEMAAPGATIYAEVRSKRLPAQVVDLPFHSPSYKR